MTTRLTYNIESDADLIEVDYDDVRGVVVIYQSDGTVTIPREVVEEVRSALYEQAAALRESSPESNPLCGVSAKAGDIRTLSAGHVECYPLDRFDNFPCVLRAGHSGDHEDSDGDRWRSK